MDASVEKLKKALKSGALAGVYIFTGEEEYLKQIYKDQLASAVCGGGESAFSLDTLDGGEFSFRRFEDAAEGCGFFSSGKLIVIRDLALTGGGGERGRRYELNGAADGKRFRETALGLPEGVHLLLYYDALFLAGLTREAAKKYDTFFKSLVKGGAELLEFKTPGAAQLMSWVARQFQAAGKTIAADAAELLLEYTGGSMTGLKQETEKLSLYAEGTLVERRHVEAVCMKSLSATVFELTDAVLGRRWSEAQHILNTLRRQREEPVAVMANLSSSLCELYYVKLGLEAGLASTDEIGRAFGVRPNRLFLLKKYRGLCRSVKTDELRRSIQAALEAEALLKGSRTEPWMALEAMVGRLALASARG